MSLRRPSASSFWPRTAGRTMPGHARHRRRGSIRAYGRPLILCRSQQVKDEGWKDELECEMPRTQKCERAFYILHFRVASFDVLAGVAISSATAQAAAPGTPLSPSADAWPMFRGDPQGTGVARGSLPEKLESALDLYLLSTPASSRPRRLSTEWYSLAAARASFMPWIWPAAGRRGSSPPRRGSCGAELARLAGFRRRSRRPVPLPGRRHRQAEVVLRRRRRDRLGANFHHDRVLFGSQDCCLYCLAVDSGKLVWKYESENQIRCFPTIVEGRAFVAGCDGQLHVIDVANGKQIGKADLESYTGCTPAVLGDMVFVGTEGKVFLGVNWRQGTVVWRMRTASTANPSVPRPRSCPRRRWSAGQDKLVHALDPKSGRKLWTFATHGRVDSSPVIVGSRVFVGSADGTFYALDRATGRPLWQFASGGKIVASAAVAAGSLVIGSDSGDLYCFGAK